MDTYRPYLFWTAGLVVALAAVIVESGAHPLPPSLDFVLGGVGVLLAAAIALIAILRFYATRGASSSLLLAVGFAGACTLDLYGLAVSADVVTGATQKTGLVMWNWALSRFFLAAVLCLRLLVWWREAAAQDRPDAHPVVLPLPAVGLGTGLAVFLILNVVHTIPLSTPIFEGGFLTRPLHLVPAGLFLFAFAAHVRRGLWKRDNLELWLAVAILVAGLGEGLFASRIGQPYDGLHLGARAACVASYALVFASIVLGTYRVITAALTREQEERRRHATHTRALQQVRKQVWRMSGEEDLENVLQAVGEGLTLLEVRFDSCALNVIDVEAMPPIVMSHTLSRDGSWHVAPSGTAEIILGLSLHGAPTYRPDLRTRDELGEYEWLRNAEHPVRSAVDIPVLNGTLFVGSAEPNAFSARDIADLEDVAAVISEGYRRLDDLRRAHESEERYRSLIETPDLIVAMYGTDGSLLYINPQVEKWTGYSPDDFLNNLDLARQLLPPSDFRRRYRAFRSALRGERVVGLELRWRRKDDDELRWAFESLFPVLDSSGRVVSIQSVTQDITDRKEIEREREQIAEQLVLAKDASERARLAQSQFLANMRHELRTPLNAIIGYSQMLLEEAQAVAQEDSAEDLLKIESAAKQLLALVNEILEMSEVEAGATRLDVDVFDVDELLADVVDFAQPLVTENGNRLTLDLPPEPGRMESDRDKIRHCVNSLLSNAAKFTEAGEIHLQVRALERDGIDGMEFCVRDTGIGMTEEQVAIAFDPFNQGDPASNRRYGGAGLGLTITRHFCQLLGGSISVESTSGLGSTFRVWMPRDRRQA